MTTMIKAAHLILLIFTGNIELSLSLICTKKERMATPIIRKQGIHYETNVFIKYQFQIWLELLFYAITK